MSDDNIVIGTKEGHLLIYKISFKSSLPPDIEIAHSNKHFSKKPILQLDMIPEHKILIALTSDNGISVHSIGVYNCEFITTLEKTKGASLFLLDIVRQTSLTGDPSITIRMCVVIGKRIQLYYWKNRAFNELRDDLSVPDTPKAITWCKEVLCLGFKNEYCLLDLLSGEQTELFATGKVNEPVIGKVGNDSLALTQEKMSIIVRPSHASHETTMQIQWSDIPTAFAYDEPYIIGVLQNKGVEIRTIKPKLLIDTMQLPGAKLACRTKSGHVYIASTNSIWCLKSTVIDVQIDFFVKQQQFELALSLANIWDEAPDIKQKKITQIQNLYAFNLFCNKKFQDAMTIFSKLGTDASNVIGLFPHLLPEHYHVVEYPGTLPEFRGKDLEDGLSALVTFLMHVRNTLILDSNSKVSNSASIVEGGATIRSRKQLLGIIDTTLLKCYLEINESLVASLLRLKENYCHPAETERVLKQKGKLTELIIMYQTKGMHKEGLEMLQKQNNFERIISYLQHLGRDHMDLILEFAKPTLKSNSQTGLKIFTEDIEEVMSLSRPRVYDFLVKNHKDLVIPYLEHVITAWGEKNALFHNALIHQYREKIQAQMDAVEKKELKNKLLAFLIQSSYYTPDIVLVHFPYDDMYEERAVILEKLGLHEQALSIYTKKLKDMDRALSYCQQVYDKNDPRKRDVFTILLRMLLNPTTPAILMPGVFLDQDEEVDEPDLNTAVKLLDEFAPCIEPSKALSSLSDELEISNIQKFLKTSVQNHLAEKRKLLIQKGLSQAEFLRVSEEKNYYESTNFLVYDSTACAHCNKKLVTPKSFNAFARCPDGSLSHHYHLKAE